VEKLRDSIGLYVNPPDRAIVLCVDKKSQVQALNRTQPILPLLAGRTGQGNRTTKAACGHVVVHRSGCGERDRHQQLLPAASASGVAVIPKTSTRTFPVVISTFTW